MRQVERYLLPQREVFTKTTALLAVSLLFHGASLAHPFGDRYAGQRLDLRVDPSGITVGLVLDLPGPLIRQLGEAPDAILQGAPLGVVITVDNETIPTTVQSTAKRTDLLQPDTNILEVVLRADVPLQGRHDIEVNNGNLIGLPGWYIDTLQTTPSLTVVETSLAIPMKDGSTEYLDGRWSQSELRRRVRIDLDGTPTWWTPWVERVEGPDYRALPDVMQAPLWSRWTSGSTAPPVAVAMAVWVGVSGLAGGLLSRRHGARLPGWLSAALVAAPVLYVGADPVIAAATVLLFLVCSSRWSFLTVGAASALAVLGIAMSWAAWKPWMLAMWTCTALLGSGLQGPRSAPEDAAPLSWVGVIATLLCLAFAAMRITA